MDHPTEKDVWIPRERSPRMWARNALADPALSARMRMFGAVAVGVGELGERGVEHGDVVLSGVGRGVAGPQQAGQGLAGVVEEAQQRVVAEAVFVGRRRVLLLGVAGDQGGVDVQDQTWQFASACTGGRYCLPSLVGLQPGDLAGGGTGRAQSAECGRIDARQQSPRGGIGRDRAEHLGPVPQQG